MNALTWIVTFINSYFETFKNVNKRKVLLHLCEQEGIKILSENPDNIINHYSFLTFTLKEKGWEDYWEPLQITFVKDDLELTLNRTNSYVTIMEQGQKIYRGRYDGLEQFNIIYDSLEI